MEKIYVGIQMASRWTDPTALLVCALPPMVVANLVGLPYLALTGRLALAAALLAAQYVLWNYVYHKVRLSPRAARAGARAGGGAGGHPMRGG